MPSGRMNLDLGQIGGGLLLVPQFTLVADTSQGHPPGVQPCGAPRGGLPLFEALCAAARARHTPVASRHIRGRHAGQPHQ